jgi:hypothetical protein
MDVLAHVQLLMRNVNFLEKTRMFLFLENYNFMRHNRKP